MKVIEIVMSDAWLSSFIGAILGILAIAIYEMVCWAKARRAEMEWSYVRGVSILLGDDHTWVTQVGHKFPGSPGKDPEAWVTGKTFQTEKLASGIWFAAVDDGWTLVMSPGVTVKKDWLLAIVEMDGPIPRGQRLIKIMRAVDRAARKVAYLQDEHIGYNGTEPVTHEALNILAEEYNSEVYHGADEPEVTAALA